MLLITIITATVAKTVYGSSTDSKQNYQTAQQPTVGYVPQGNETNVTKKHLRPHVQHYLQHPRSGDSHSGQDKENVVYKHNGMLVGHIKG